MIIASRAALAVGACLLASPLAAAPPDGPRPVSPGSRAASLSLAQSCPTFSWSGTDPATGYELVVHQVTGGGGLKEHLRVEVSGDARAWSPSAAHCFSASGRFAWSIRALGDSGPGKWSDALLFETPNTPTSDEVRRALQVLRSFSETAAGETVSNLKVKEKSDRQDGGPMEQPGARIGHSRSVLPRALVAETVGPRAPSPAAVPSGSISLDIEDGLDLGGYLFKNGVPFLHNDGGEQFRNTAVGLNALINATPAGIMTGASNSALGAEALRYNTTGSANTAVGAYSLLDNTEGRANTAVGFAALLNNVAGTYNTALGRGALDNNAAGSFNTAVGADALGQSFSASFNTALGVSALHHGGVASTAVGFRASFAGGAQHATAVGHESLHRSQGNYNTALGSETLYFNTVGVSNTAIGRRALWANYDGSGNTAIGTLAGSNWNYGNNNIAVGYGALGEGNEAGTIRIGGGNLQTRTFIEGIRGATGATLFDEEVCTNSEEQLGPCTTSSLRFKKDVAAMGEVAGLRALRPVTFRFEDNEETSDEQPLQYGLIAEEVAELFPSLVSYDEDGRPRTVRYSLLTPLLLNQVQRQDEELRALREQMAERDRELADLRRTVEKLAKKKRFR